MQCVSVCERWWTGNGSAEAKNSLSLGNIDTTSKLRSGTADRGRLPHVTSAIRFAWITSASAASVVWPWLAHWVFDLFSTICRAIFFATESTCIGGTATASLSVRYLLCSLMHSATDKQTTSSFLSQVTGQGCANPRKPVDRATLGLIPARQPRACARVRISQLTFAAPFLQEQPHFRAWCLQRRGRLASLRAVARWVKQVTHPRGEESGSRTNPGLPSGMCCGRGDHGRGAKLIAWPRMAIRSEDAAWLHTAVGTTNNGKNCYCTTVSAEFC